MGRIINLCLIPDNRDDIGQKFRQTAITLSQHLNLQAPSLYCLATDKPALPAESRPHCTVMHVVASTDNDMVRLGKNLLPLIGQRISVQVRGATFLPSLGKWERRLMAATGPVEDPTPNEKHNVIWTEVRLTSTFRALQTTLDTVVSKTLGNSARKTAIGDNSNPHFTLWVNQDTKNALLPTLHWSTLAGQFAEIPCRLAIGDVGPHGQVRRTSFQTMAKIKEFSHLDPTL